MIATLAVILLLALVGTGVGLGLKHSSSSGSSNTSKNDSWAVDFMGNESIKDSFRIYEVAPEPSRTKLGTYSNAAVALDGEPCAEIAR